MDGIRPADIHDIQNRLVFATKARPGRKSVVNQLIEMGCPIHFGSLSEPLQLIDKKYRVTFRAIEIFRDHDYPIVISTKGPLLGDAEYLGLLASHKKCALQVSFSTLDDDLGSKIEPCAPLPSERIKMIAQAVSRGIWTSVRFQPFLFPVQNVDDYNLALLAEIGVKHIIVEHLRIPTNFDRKALSNLSTVLGIDILDYYRRHGMQINRVNYELPSAAKLRNIVEFRNRAHEVGLTFGCGDNDLHHLSDDECCCGVKTLGGFEKIYRGSFLTALMSCDSDGRINFETVKEAWQPDGSIREYLNSDCRDPDCARPIEYLRHKWNNPRLSNSLTSFYGVEYKREESGYSYRLTRECLKLMGRV